MNTDKNLPHQQTTSAPPAVSRMLVPDFARGIALLGIALANIPTAWLSTPDNLIFFGPIDSGVDRFIAVLSAMIVHNRGLPMFSTLLGFGVGLITMSLWRKGFPFARTRAILIRRYGFLALIGLAHLLLLFFGDIMMFYGLCGIFLALMLKAKDKTLLIIAYIALGFALLVGAAFLVLGLMDPQSMTEGLEAGREFGDVLAMTSYAAVLKFNAIALATSLFSFPMFVLSYLPVMMIGFVWARRGVLANPDQHRKTLVTWSAIAVIVIIGIGLPWGLATIGILPLEYSAGFAMCNMMMGTITGPGILALIALALQPIQRRLNAGASAPAWSTPFVALGKRSMTGYVLQSICFFILCYPLAMGISPEISIAWQSALALAVWAATVAIAWGLEVTRTPGPFEYVHRRLSYGPTRTPQR